MLIGVYRDSKDGPMLVYAIEADPKTAVECCVAACRFFAHHEPLYDPTVKAIGKLEASGWYNRGYCHKGYYFNPGI